MRVSINIDITVNAIVKRILSAYPALVTDEDKITSIINDGICDTFREDDVNSLSIDGKEIELSDHETIELLASLQERIEKLSMVIYSHKNMLEVAENLMNRIEGEETKP